MIWIIGGTSDSIQIMERLLKKHKKLLVSTTTEYGSQLATRENILVVQKKLNKQDMLSLIYNHKIDLVIDASHPYAAEVSKNAIEASKTADIQYIRFERKSKPVEGATYHTSYHDLIHYLMKSEGNIFLTIGSKNLYRFKDIDPNRIVVRVLPTTESLDMCKKAGIRTDHILAMKGLVGENTNKALLSEFKIRHLVTKDSGIAGGFCEKVQAAHNLKINVHVIQRPIINYPEIFEDFPDIDKYLT